MKKVEAYIEKLRSIEDWDAYLMQESGLPGPRGNLELIQAAAEAGDEELFLHLLSFTPEKAPVNTPEEFLAACGAVGLGRLASEGKREYLKVLNSLASDPRWRMREAVAIALQKYGEIHMDDLINEMSSWAEGGFLEQRAAAAALCEPKLLTRKEQVQKVLVILDMIMQTIVKAESRKDEGFIALRKGMAYCWSVAIVYNSDEGRRIFDKWIGSPDKDINWIVRENLKKDRLRRMDESWVKECMEKNELGK